MFTTTRHRIMTIVEQTDGQGSTDAESQQGATAPETDDGYKADKPVDQMTPEEQADYWKHYARKHEAQAAALRKRLDSQSDYAELREQADKAAESTKTDEQKQLEQARLEGENIAAQKYQRILVTSQLQTALASEGFPAESLDELTSHLDASGFLDESGDIDHEKVSRYTKALAAGRPPQQSRPTGTGVSFPSTNTKGGSVSSFYGQYIKKLEGQHNG